MKKLMMFILLGMFMLTIVNATTINDVTVFEEGNIRNLTIKESLLGQEKMSIVLETELLENVGIGYVQIGQIKIKNLLQEDLNDFIAEIETYKIKIDGLETTNKNIDLKYQTNYIITQPTYNKKENFTYSNNTISYYYEQNGTKEVIQEGWVDLTTNILLQGQEITVGLFTTTTPGEKGEWVPTFLNERIPEWAAWEASLYNDLLSYYALNETTGSIIDRTGNYTLETFGTVTRGVTGFSSKTGFSNTFSGTGVINGTDHFRNTNTGFTINLWAKLQTLGNDDIVFGEDGIIQMGKAANNSFSFISRTLTEAAWHRTYGPIMSTGQWYMLTFRYNNTHIQMFINGTAYGNMAMTGTLSSGVDWHEAIGAWTVHETGIIILGWDGQIDEVMLWSSGKTDTEINLLWDGGQGTFYGELGGGGNVTTIQNSPSDNTLLRSNTTQDFSYTILAGTENITNSTFRLWDGNILINETIYNYYPLNNDTVQNQITTINFQLLPQATYKWEVEGCTTDSVCDNSATNYTLIFNTTPSIEFISPTYVNDSTENITSIPIRVNITEGEVASVDFQVWNSSGVQETATITATNPAEYNTTFGLINGEYFYNATAYDNSGQQNSTEIRNINVLGTDQNVTLITPTNDGIIINKNQTFIAEGTTALRTINSTLYTNQSGTLIPVAWKNYTYGIYDVFNSGEKREDLWTWNNGTITINGTWFLTETYSTAQKYNNMLSYSGGTGIIEANITMSSLPTTEEIKSLNVTLYSNQIRANPSNGDRVYTRFFVFGNMIHEYNQTTDTYGVNKFEDLYMENNGTTNYFDIYIDDIYTETIIAINNKIVALGHLEAVDTTKFQSLNTGFFANPETKFNVEGKTEYVTADYPIITTVTDGEYLEWNTEICDTSGTCTSSPLTFTATANIPVNADYITPTPTNNSEVNNGTFTIAYEDINNVMTNSTTRIYNYQGSIIEEQYNNTNPGTIIFTGLDNGHYEFNTTIYKGITATDLETRKIHINHTTVELITPTDNTIATDPTINFTGNNSFFETLTNASLYSNITGTWQIENTTTEFSTISQIATKTGQITWQNNAYTSRINVSMNNKRLEYITGDIGVETGLIGTATGYIFWRIHYDDGTTADTAESSTSAYRLSYNVTNPNIAKTVNFTEAWMKKVSAVSGNAEENGTIFYGYGPTYSEEVTFTQTITEGTIWNIEFCDETGFCQQAENNYTILEDITKPAITINSPTNKFLQTNGENIYYNSTTTDAGTIDTCWYEYAGTNTTHTCNVNQEIAYVHPYKNITGWANDTFGNLGTTTYLWVYNVVITGETYETEVIETTTTTFTFDLNYNNTQWTGITSNLTYEGTAYTGTQTGTGNDITFTREIIAPSVTNDTNKTFYWSIDFTNITGTYNVISTTHNQTVSKVTFGLCGIGETPFINFTTLTANPPIQKINTTFKSWWQIYNSEGDGSIVKNESYEDLTETKNTWQFCISPNNTNYTVSMQALADATDFTPTNYYLTDVIFTGETQNVSMYLLNDSLSTLTEIKVVDNAYNGIEGVLVFIQRYDVGTDTYYNIDMAKTSYDGTDLVYLHWYDTWYKFILVKDGTTILTTTAKKISSTPQTFQITDTTTFDFRKFGEIEYIINFDNVSRIFSLTYTMPSAEVTSGCLRVIKRNTTNDYDICNVCETSSSATVYCDASNYGNGTFIATFYATGSLAIIDRIYEAIGVHTLIYDELGNLDGTALAIITAGIVVSLFLYSPIMAVVGVLIGMGAAFALGFQPLDLMTFLGIIIMGWIVILLIRK